MTAPSRNSGGGGNVRCSSRRASMAAWAGSASTGGKDMTSPKRPRTLIPPTVVPARVISGVVFLLAALVVQGSAAAAPAPPGGSARAYAVRVIVPSANGATAALVPAPPQAAASLPAYSWGNGVVTTGALSTGARSTIGSTSRESASAASAVSVVLFGGEITASSVDLRVVARASGTGAQGRFAAASLTGLTVLGEAVEPAVNKRVQPADWAYAVLFARADPG